MRSHYIRLILSRMTSWLCYRAFILPIYPPTNIPLLVTMTPSDSSLLNLPRSESATPGCILLCLSKAYVEFSFCDRLNCVVSKNERLAVLDFLDNRYI